MRSIGPVEYVLISFPTTNFNGDIAPALADLVDEGTVRIIDLVFVRKDADGAILTFEYDDLTETASFGGIDGDADGFFGDEDIAHAVAALPADSAALLIVWEDLWATKFASAVRAVGGEVIAGERIPHDLVVEIMEAIDQELGATS